MKKELDISEIIRVIEELLKATPERHKESLTYYKHDDNCIWCNGRKVLEKLKNMR